jgi:hypothetical protein
MPSLSGPCPQCGHKAPLRVLYAGLPARYCDEGGCGCLWGPGE